MSHGCQPADVAIEVVDIDLLPNRSLRAGTADRRFSSWTAYRRMVWLRLFAVETCAVIDI